MTEWVHMVHDDHGGVPTRLPADVVDHFTDKGWYQVEVDEDGQVVKKVTEKRSTTKKES